MPLLLGRRCICIAWTSWRQLINFCSTYHSILLKIIRKSGTSSQCSSYNFKTGFSYFCFFNIFWFLFLKKILLPCTADVWIIGKKSELQKTSFWYSPQFVKRKSIWARFSMLQTWIKCIMNVVFILQNFLNNARNIIHECIFQVSMK